ncbi:hypothetical protein ACP70R_015700 [Stipagrostis hirtigluma subsp. patula]
MCPNASTPVTGDADADTDVTVVLAKLRASRAAIVSVLSDAAEAEVDIDAAGDRLAELLSSATPSSSHLQSQAVAARALRARIDRAVGPAEPLLAAFRRVSTLAGEEAVGFLGRTKAAGRGRVRRLTEAAAALRAVYETEAEDMRFEGLLDDALLGLQDLLEALLLRLKYPAPADDDDFAGAEGEDMTGYDLGTNDEVDAAARMARTLAGNDCLDICLDIYVKTRYRRAAKAMMRLNPAYLKSYTPEAIDAMEWEALWIPHFHVAVASVLAAERRLCARVLEHLPPPVWPECFAKIATCIVAAFFCFADGVAAAAREPQRLFKLLDMLDAVRAREVERALARAAAGVFFEFGLRIETHYVTGAGTDADGHVPKIVRYAVNYHKCLASDDYRALMDTALRAERERGGGGGGEDTEKGAGGGDHTRLAEAASNVLEALHRHVEAKAVRGAYAGFLKANDKTAAAGRREVLPVDVIEGMIRRVFDEMGDGFASSVGRARSSRSRRESRGSGNLDGFDG